MLRLVQDHAALGALRLPETGADLLDHLGAEPRQLGDLAGLDRLPEVGDGFHLEFLVEQPDPFRAEPLNAQEIEEAGGQLLDERAPLRHLAGRHQRFDLAGDPLADAGQLREIEAAGAHQLGERLGVVAHGARGVAVGAHLEGVPVGHLEEVGDLVELAGDVGILHRHNSSTGRPVLAEGASR